MSREAGGLVEIQPAGHFGQAEGLVGVGHQQVKDGEGAGRGLGKKSHRYTPFVAVHGAQNQ